MNQATNPRIEPCVGLTRSQKNLLVDVATASHGLPHDTLTGPLLRAATFLEACGLISRAGDRWSVTDAGQRRCTSIY